jgi:hypothetical protein
MTEQDLAVFVLKHSKNERLSLMGAIDAARCMDRNWVGHERVCAQYIAYTFNLSTEIEDAISNLLLSEAESAPLYTDSGGVTHVTRMSDDS